MPIKVTKDLFERQGKRRFGRKNPEPMAVPVWEWIVRRGTNPYVARTDLGLERHYNDPEPDWCFERFGMSRTPMPDGRIICIAGEHEDSYDPDFCIYNDVVVLRPAPGQSGVTPESGTVEIYGYPADLFPPTDFHSATLVGDRVFIIGRLGYAGTRTPAETPVLVLDTTNYRVETIPTKGRPPGWVYEHHASYDAATNSITVRGGKIEILDRERETPNLSAYRLRLADYTWEQIAEKEKHRRFLIRADDSAPELREATADTFRPEGIPHDGLLPEEHGVWVYGISVQGVRISFEEFYSEIRTLVEGDLPSELVARLLAEITKNLERDTGARWTVTEVDQWEEP